MDQLFNKEWIRTKAEAALHSQIKHITDEQAPMSAGGKNDFYSNGDYWWPNPDAPDGLPYVNRDGASNPNAFTAHRQILRQFRTCVANLTAGYLVSGNEAYATKVGQYVSEFLLDPETKMNPHLLYAQALPGICSGRGIGIIDTLHLIDVSQALKILQDGSCVDTDIIQGARQWFREYLKWITSHSYGIEEMNATNNHAVCWLVQAAAFAQFVDDTDVIRFCKERYKRVLLPQQMAVDGSFPRELKRTKPYGYSIFVLDNMAILCQILSTAEDNLWRYELADGRGIRKGFEFLYPYLVDKSTWKSPPDLMHFDAWPVAVASLVFAGLGLGEQKYLDLWQQLDQDPDNDEVRRNMAIRQPLLWTRGYSLQLGFKVELVPSEYTSEHNHTMRDQISPVKTTEHHRKSCNCVLLI